MNSITNLVVDDDAQRSEFRVIEAPLDQIIPGIARISRADMARLGLDEGSVVTLTGSRQSAARIMPLDSSPEVDGTLGGGNRTGVIQIGGALRDNTGVSLDGHVLVAPATHRPAARITVAPVRPVQSLPPAHGGSPLRRLLRRLAPGRRLEMPGAAMAAWRDAIRGMPVIKGDWVRIEQPGHALDFRITDTEPAGVVIAGGETALELASGAWSREGGPAVSYEDIGGLGKEIARVREMVDLPLRYPELFAQLGIDPPKGLLLYGPPGSGKTLIARAVAHESKAHFISVNGPEVIQQGYGESEAQLRRIFAEAQEHPSSIIFFDEIDALAPNRDTTLGEVEKRVVGQLLSLMDGLAARGKIVVIGATNLPNNIDPALRRPGRFDREIALQPPDKVGRLEILQVHTRGMPLAKDVKLEEIAANTHGFLGADIAALCREAAICCARDALLTIESAQGTADRETVASLRVQMRHFSLARGEIELSTTRQIVTEIPGVNWSDVGGLDDVKSLLTEAVEWPLKYGRRFEFARTRPPKGILLTGRPGTGKTLIANAIGAESGLNFISVKGPELLSKWVGESERGIREIFRKARQAAPALVFFDEIDAILPVRGKGDGVGNVSERMVGQFLVEMDSIEPLKGVVVLAATSRPDLIDRALLRPGRFDIVLELPFPDYKERLAILQVHTRGRLASSDVSLPALAEDTDGMSGAEIESLCRSAAMLAIRDSIDREPGREFAAFSVRHTHFVSALASQRGRELQTHATIGGS